MSARTQTSHGAASTGRAPKGGSDQRTLSQERQAPSPLERYAWTALIACVAIVPLAISKVPWRDHPFTYTVFAFPQTVTLVVGLAIALALWALGRARRRTALVFARPTHALGAFATWAAVATAAAYEPLRSLLGGSSASLSLLAIFAYTALFALTVQMVDSESRMLTLVRAVIFSATAVALIALLQQLLNADLFGLPTLPDWFVSRGCSTIWKPDHPGT